MQRDGSGAVPNRVLREGILKSPRINKLSERAELFYRRLMSVVDDFGRFDALPVLLRAAVYPLRIDKIGDDDVQGFLDECVAARLLAVYVVGGQPYLELIDFRQHARAKESRFPAPELQAQCVSDAPAVHVQRTRTAYAPGDGDGDGGEGGGEGEGEDGVEVAHAAAPQPPPARSPAAHGSRIPPDFPDDDAITFCRSERPDLDPLRVRDKFRDYWLGVPGSKGRKADWRATWRNFVRGEFAPRSNAITGPPVRAPTAAERAAANVASLTGRNRNPPPVTIDVEPTPTARLG